MLRKRWVAAAALAAAAYTAPAASAETVYGLTDSNDIVTFDSASPGTVSPTLDVVLPESVTQIEGIDVRPATLQLYALGNTGQLFKIDTVTGNATTVGAPLALNGTDFDIDFNPTVDRLRIVSDTEQNLRVNPNNGALVDSDPNTAGVQPDGNLTPAGNVTGAAYINSAPASSAADGADADLLPDAPTTTLFDIDTVSNQLLTQNPPNAGTLVDGKPLGVNVEGDVGFDISTTSTTGTGAPGTNTAYLVGRTTDTLDRLYTVNTTTGAATAVGEVAGSSKVKDIAVAAAVPQVVVLYTPLLGAQQLVTYRVDRPETAGTTVPISGTNGNEALVGIDRRPANGLVYGVGGSGRVYTINVLTGAATLAGVGPFTALPAGDAGIDFNPAPGAAIRAVFENDQNFGIDSTSSMTTAQTNLAYATGDPNAAANPNVTGVAYNNPVTPAPASTLLFDIDTGLDILAAQGIRDAAGANLLAPAFGNGVLSTIGALGVAIEDGTGFDIAARFNQQFGAFDPTPAQDPARLYSVNASGGAGTAPNGSAALIGDLGGVPAPTLTTTIAGMTVVNDNVLPPAPTPVATATPTATATYTVPTPTATATPGPYTQKVTPGLTAKVKPKKDKKKPFKFTVSGRLNPKSAGKTACTGKIKITAKKGKKTVAKKTTKVKKSCAYAAKIKLGKKAGKRGTVKFTARFGGNAKLNPKSAKTSAKYGKKKKRK